MLLTAARAERYKCQNPALAMHGTEEAYLRFSMQSTYIGRA
jgi:hypothetical protein